jgi:hypothetical protein
VPYRIVDVCATWTIVIVVVVVVIVFVAIATTMTIDDVTTVSPQEDEHGVVRARVPQQSYQGRRVPRMHPSRYATANTTARTITTATATATTRRRRWQQITDHAIEFVQ